jgi:hypothetical protein
MTENEHPTISYFLSFIRGVFDTFSFVEKYLKSSANENLAGQ